MIFSEQILFFLAKFFYKGEVGHSKEMKRALSDRQEYNKYRGGQIDKILSAAGKYGLDIVDKTVLDMGCNDGAITGGYLERGARDAIGVDIDEAAIEFAQKHRSSNRLTFIHSTTSTLPIADSSVDSIICYDVFEHVSSPVTMLEECYRVLRPGGRMLIGTWGWHHPFAPHLWSTMPVPWAHVFFSEKTLLRTCRRVYNSSWYIPNMHDLDETGRKIEGKFCQDSIDEEYLNKFLIKDFVKVFEGSKFTFQVHPQPFGSKYARWTRFFLKTPYVSEFVTSYIWVVLSKEMNEQRSRKV
jgi:2-polyprenyl-3-methyl-5-hydroxy-6-metoxy-1,4-benzoquinol methylase